MASRRSRTTRQGLHAGGVDLVDASGVEDQVAQFGQAHQRFQDPVLKEAGGAETESVIETDDGDERVEGQIVGIRVDEAPFGCRDK